MNSRLPPALDRPYCVLDAQKLGALSIHASTVPPDALPRATHKAKRIENRRRHVWS